MPSRQLKFAAAPLAAVPIVWAFLLIGGGAPEAPTEPPVEQATTHLTPRSRSCDPPAGPCWQGIARTPLEC